MHISALLELQVVNNYDMLLIQELELLLTPGPAIRYCPVAVVTLTAIMNESISDIQFGRP